MSNPGFHFSSPDIQLKPSLSFDFRALVGQRVGGFQLRQIQSAGPLTVVYLAERTDDPSVVRDVTITHPDLAASPSFGPRVADEAGVIEKLGHPHIARFYNLHRETVQDQDVYVFEHEHIEGQSLDEVFVECAERPLSIESVLGWMAQAADAVAAAHAAGLVHRALKPRDIVITRDRQVKIVGFGIARAIDDADRVSRLSRGGNVRGAPPYMSPETCNGAVPDASADVYALGIIMVEALLGHHPFCTALGDGPRTPSQWMLAHVSRSIPSVRRKRPDVSLSFSLVIKRATAKNALERFRDASEFANALRTIAPDHPAELRRSAPPIVVDELEPDEPPTMGMGHELRDEAVARAEAEAEPEPAPAPEPEAASASVEVQSDVLEAKPMSIEPQPPSIEPKAPPAESKRDSGEYHLEPVEVPSVRPPPLPRRAPAQKPPAGQGNMHLVAGAVALALLVTPIFVTAVRNREPDPEPAAHTAASTPAPTPAPNAAETPAHTQPPAPNEHANALNRWVRVAVPAQPVTLGVSGDSLPEATTGFRPARRVTSPSADFEIQQHEVSWQEFDPWRAQNSGVVIHAPGWLSPDPAQRAKLPATGIPWDVARAYCRSLGATLPTEEQWEFAARGTALRPLPWGSDAIDLARTRVFGGAAARLMDVMSSDQDVTPGPSQGAVYDMLGNAQEWTLNLYRLDTPATPQDEAWVQSDGRTFRAVRGLTVNTTAPAPLPTEGLAARSALCATGACPADVVEALQYVGFRCVRTVTR
jgi:serine/threonine-protein kinase